MAKKTITPVTTITAEAVKEQLKTCLTPRDAQDNPVPDRNLTDSQRTWLTVDEITDVLKIKAPEGGITKAAVVKAVTELVQEGVVKQRFREPLHISEYTSTY